MQVKESAISSWQPPGNDLYRQLVAAVVEKADTNAAIGIGRNNRRRSAFNELPAFWQDHDIAFDTQRTVENELPILNAIRRSVGVSLENPDTWLPAFGNRAGQMDATEFSVVLAFPRH